MESHADRGFGRGRCELELVDMRFMDGADAC